VRKPYCGHIFHPKCIGSWLEKSETCPLCKAILDKIRLEIYWEKKYGTLKTKKVMLNLNELVSSLEEEELKKDTEGIL